MSVVVQNVSRWYGAQKAVDTISFTANKGEVVGFLGPNGAGKSTTMKMITGFLPPQEGTILVEGFNVGLDPIAVKGQIGYLPEHNPLYLDMYVHEYLHFVGGLYGMSSSQRKQRTSDMIGLCGLTLEQNKKIGMLSKGFRQRVGLAQALIHDPAVLILDEPTSGLDPNQLVEIRNVIKDISREKTVIFSTHILQEVKAICSRVVVINRGRIVADDQLDTLMRRRQKSVHVEFTSPVDVSLLTALPNVASVESLGGARYRIQATGDADLRPSLVTWSTQSGVDLLEIRQSEESLEQVFSQLTQTTERTDA